ncbi:MAG: hypothetical protein JWN78_2690 [Bacteroidota bacterium]|nr:hypothetical protein [Bacteroidota bacterium]
MKNFLTLCIFFLSACICLGQAPQAFNYSAVVRNGSGVPIPNQNVKFRLSILRGTITGPSVYVETHSTTTDGNGMVNLEIGRGTIISGVFAAIPWNNDAFFFQVEVDPTGGNAFQMMGTTQFLSVPYALNAKYAESVAAQFGLFHDQDTVFTYKNNNLRHFGTINPFRNFIKYFGGSPEDFTFHVTSIPLGISFIPSSDFHSVEELKNRSEFIELPVLNISSAAANGFFTINTDITTASNRVTNNSFVLNVIDDCFADSKIPDNASATTSVGLVGWLCGNHDAVDSTVVTIINPNPSDCAFKVKLNKYNLTFDCAIIQDSIFITGTGNIGPITGVNSTVNSIAINGGYGYIYSDLNARPFVPSSITLYFNTIMNYTIASGFCANGTYTINLTGLTDAEGSAVWVGW